MRNTVSEHVLYSTEKARVTKTVEYEQNDGRHDLIIKKDASVVLFNREFVTIDRYKNNQGDIARTVYYENGCNDLITLLDFFERGLVKKGARDFLICGLHIRATIATQGSENLCLNVMVDAETPAQEPPVYFTPAEAANLQRCIYHVASFLARP
ncbi:hypothetical protein M1B72_02715 [Geomonas paludis]|uniref:Uncharacterized protein n=1 Tax=Geomonas paludis TaxID=2740185 RepID=A0A6V8N3M7_9BACT|nr:hypothetical protein [Geomonas paludis]UPU36636.1 hypothetical protein M1B72_02715 [Geomonas paludis]GFO65899.1 hypothetical protein GMPD_38180 [Geomonas paludis]